MKRRTIHYRSRSGAPRRVRLGPALAAAVNPHDAQQIHDGITAATGTEPGWQQVQASLEKLAKQRLGK